MAQIEQLERAGLEAIERAATSDELERARVAHLGRRAPLPNLLRSVAQLDGDRRALVGAAANRARRALEQAVERRSAQLSAQELHARLVAEGVDVTLPADPRPQVGRLHLITQTRRQIEDVFVALGYEVVEGPEVETVHYNFDALNHSPTHPSRLPTDTFYLDRAGAPLDIFDPDAPLLRVHTSPMQIRAMEAQPPPIRVIVPGRVFRPDSDATHSPQFHQVEGLAVDEDITLADLKGTLLTFARAIFGEQREVRLRPHFFPFTEPSVEVDVSCFACAQGANGRCSLCRGTGWIEILGASMVDPAVLGAVAEHGYDPERVQGFAFGMGVERIAMLRHGIPDLRLLYDNDVRMLEQF